MEGINMGGILLGYLAVLVFALVSLVALGLLIARLFRAALIVFASGLLVATVIAAVAALSFLDPQFRQGETEAKIILTALTLLLAGAGQFVAAFRNPRTYASAFACAVGSLGYGMAASLGESDLFRLQLPAGFEVSLLLAAASLLIAILPSRHSRFLPVWMAMAIWGGVLGFVLGNACVTTRCSIFEPQGRGNKVRLEVFVFTVCVSDEFGIVRIPDEGVRNVHSVSNAQAAWVYGTPAAGALLGMIAGLAIAALLVRRKATSEQPEPADSADWPRARGPSSDQIKPA